MKPFLVLLLSLAYVYADVGVGYEYEKPKKAINFGGVHQMELIPSLSAYASGQSDSHLSLPSPVQTTNFASNVQDSGSAFSQQGGGQAVDSRYNAGSSGFQGASHSGGSSGFQGGSHAGGASGFQSGGGDFQGSISHAGGASGFQGSQTGFSGAEGAANLRKFYYVYEAPDFQQAHITKNVVEAQPEQRVNIIFIKAPSYSSRSGATYSLRPKIEERTKVYVLVKEAEEHDEEAPQPEAAPPPLKPEVLFVKYKGYNNAEGISGASLLTGGNIDESEINKELISAGGLKNVAGFYAGGGSSHGAGGGSGFNAGGSGFSSGGGAFSSGGTQFNAGGSGFNAGGSGFNAGSGFGSTASRFDGDSGFNAGSSFTTGQSGFGSAGGFDSAGKGSQQVQFKTYGTPN